MTVNPIFMPIRELGELVRQRQASPVEIAEIFLQRLDSIGPRYNAVVTVTRERAMEQARRAESEIAAGDYKGLLHGIPYGAKDLLATSGGIPTTWGAAPFREQVFDYDAAVVRRLEEAGAPLAAKLAMVEIAGGMGYRQPNASFTGPGMTPWGTDAWSGGSSSGSGASVAAGLVPFAIGSETWGSILSPANNCGLSGLRPTYGRVSRQGAMVLSWSLDKLGPLCLTADDCGIVLEAIAGADADDPSTSDRPYRYDIYASTGRRFKLAVIKDVTEGAQAEVAANFERALQALEDVADIEEIEFPEMPYEAVTRTILNAESASAFEEFIESGGVSGLTAPECHHPHARLMIPAQDYIRALRIRGKVARIADEVMAGYDAVVGPTRPVTATPIDQDFRGVVAGTAARHDGRGGEQRGAACDKRSERLLGRGAANWSAVHGAGIR